MKNKKKILALVGIATLVLSSIGLTSAFFTDKGQVLGSSFSVGSADIKLLNDVTAGVFEENLVDELPGPTFSNIAPGWSHDYLTKIYNNAGVDLLLSTNANYETANDPAELRQLIFVEPFSWNDENNNGLVDENEPGETFGKKSIVKWKTEGFDLGQINSGEVKSLILRFSADSVPDTKQGTTGIFDFEFDTVGM